jgi:hypothetical protein
MVLRVIKDKFDMEGMAVFLSHKRFPFTLEYTDGASRSVEQNKLQRLWVNEIAEQVGEVPERVRGMIKLHHGVPILRRDDDEFKAKYDRIIRPMHYEDKLSCMMVPFDFPVTRIMTQKQKTEYLDTVFKHYSEQGIVLTIPEKGR